MAERLNNFRAIATAYRGYEFRSRLEAKYAVFFDLCGWQWSYEPIDLPGWIPDFTLGEQNTLVEIKPFFEWRQFDEAKAKIHKSGCTESVILFGADPTRHPGTWNDGPAVAWLYEPCGECAYYAKHPHFDGADIHADIRNREHDGRCPVTVSDLHFGFTEGNDKLGLCPMDGGWSNWIWNPPEGISHPNKWSRVCLEEHDTEKQLVARWAQACNVSKWIPTNDS